MSYALATLWYERQRYLPGILAVAFSALLIALQCGLLLGLFGITSMPVDHTDADVWVGGPSVLSVDLGTNVHEGEVAVGVEHEELGRTTRAAASRGGARGRLAGRLRGATVVGRGRRLRRDRHGGDRRGGDGLGWRLQFQRGGLHRCGRGLQRAAGRLRCGLGVEGGGVQQGAALGGRFGQRHGRSVNVSVKCKKPHSGRLGGFSEGGKSVV